MGLCQFQRIIWDPFSAFESKVRLVGARFGSHREEKVICANQLSDLPVMVRPFLIE